jgi:hypothetical protein
MRKGIVAAALAVTLTGFGLGCSDSGRGPDVDLGGTCDYLVVPGILEGETFRNWTERDCPVRLSLPMEVFVDLLANDVDENPTFPPNSIAAFVLDKYIVTYRNVTQNGESVPRVDVPEPFQFTPAAVVGNDGFPATFELLGAPVLQLSAKGQPPLNQDSFYFDRTDPRSGVVLEADIVWWGHPVGQSSRECRGTMRFRFTVFDEDDPTDQAAICASELAIEEG